MTEFGSDAWRPVPGFGSKCMFTAKNLPEGKRLVFRVRAENLYGLSEPLVGNPIVPKSPFNPPDAPSQPEILGYTPNSCQLSWQPPTQTGGKPITGKKKLIFSYWQEPIKIYFVTNIYFGLFF